MPQIIFSPSRYRIFPDAATTPPFFPPDVAEQAIPSLPDQPGFSVDDVVGVGIPPAAVSQAPSQAPSRKRQILSLLGRGIQSGIDAAAVPNIAAGGGTDVMRGLSHALDRQYQRDMTAAEMDRRNRIEQAQAAQDMAQAEWYRRRADAAATGVWVNDGNGMQHNTVTGEQRPVGGVNAAEARQKAEQQKLEERKRALIAAGIDPASREGFAALYGTAGSVLPKTGSTTGAQGQRMFYRMGADGVPVFTQEVAAPPKLGTVRGPAGETVFVEQRPGEGGKAMNSTPGVPPRAASPARPGRTPTPAAAHTQAVTQFVDRLLSDAQKRGISTEFAIKAAENPQYYTDVPPSVKMDAVTRMKRAMDYRQKRAESGGAGGGGGVKAGIAGSGGGTATSAPAAGVPVVGQIEDGYRFKGGNPADPNNWEAVR